MKRVIAIEPANRDNGGGGKKKGAFFGEVFCRAGGYSRI